MRTEPTAVSTFDVKTVRRRLEGTLAEKLAALASQRDASGRRRTKENVLIVALMALNMANVSSTMPKTSKVLIAAAILLVVLATSLVAFSSLWAERVLNIRRPQGAGMGLSEAEIDAWLAGLPAITLVGKERLATLLAMNAIDLEVIGAWIDREVERLEIADEERRLGLRSVTADLRLAKVATIRGENEVAHLEASS